MASIKHLVGDVLALAGVGYLLVFAPCSFAAAPAPDCKSLASMKIPQTTIAGAELVAAGTFKAPGGDPTPDLKAFCRVTGIAKPSSDSDIKFEVWLPAADWNGRLWGAGNGGFAGAVPYESLGGGSLEDGLAEGYAAVGTDAGHEGGPTDGGWAIGHPEKVIDYGYRAIHEATVRAKLILSAFYGRKAAHAYFCGCSDGGREALMEAERYPDDYDGIIAGAPVISATDLFAGIASIDFAWFGAGEKAGYFPPSKLPAIQAAALAACDGIDGIKDGLIDDPRRCGFDPSVLLCQGPETDQCLTQAQVAALRVIYKGQVLADGATLPGYSPGAETGSGGWSWDGWITSSPQTNSGFHNFAYGYFSGLVFENPKWDFHSFDPDRDVKAADRKLAPVLDATDPDLGKFVAHGGKLILYQGWADQAIPPLMTVDYYERVRETIGQKAAAGSVRLFMVPGMMHCFGGPGPNNFGQFAAGTGDPNTKIAAALQRWVEEGTAPEQIIATKRKPDGDVVRTRPLCAFPNIAHYRGTGSTDDAANFECVAPPGA
ncbi:MAG TPA: tannase/feruloyl esterase family alpha/beta hydrolase [Gammaproteobacteria bacterium]|nr:tannase/feruloyl esterase family alpha/beta hydrolase [Gammaproteobacteria bacterium]